MSEDQTSRQPAYAPPRPAPRPVARLTRSRHGRWLGGVCAGVAEYAGMDVTVVRILLVLGTLLGFGTLVLVYLACWLLIPED